MLHSLPIKEIIVNDDSQVIALEDDGTAYADNDIVADTSGGFILDGFINEILWASKTAADANGNKGGKNSYIRFWSGSDRMLKTAYNAGAAEIGAWLIATSGTAKAGDTYRVVVDSLELTPTEFQNRPTEKRYQLSVDCATAAAIVTELVARINADKYSQVTAYAGFNNVTPAQDDTAKIVLVPKKVGQTVGLYVGQYSVVDQATYLVSATKQAAATTVYHTAEDTSAVTAAAVLPKGTYDAVKNINWSKNFNIDVNLNWMPIPGANYNMYYFEVATQQLQSQSGSNPNLNEVAGEQVYGVRLYVKNGLTLDSALTLIEGDLG
jgi:hypothetical protein